MTESQTINPLNDELNPICHLLALLEAHHIFHVSGLRVNVREPVCWVFKLKNCGKPLFAVHFLGSHNTVPQQAITCENRYSTFRFFCVSYKRLTSTDYDIASHTKIKQDARTTYGPRK
jgi:hypothetical protein